MAELLRANTFDFGYFSATNTATDPQPHPKSKIVCPEKLKIEIFVSICSNISILGQIRNSKNNNRINMPFKSTMGRGQGTGGGLGGPTPLELEIYIEKISKIRKIYIFS